MKKKVRRPAREEGMSSPVGDDQGVSVDNMQTTGRYICVFREGTAKEAVAALSSRVGLKNTVRAADFESAAIDMEQAADADVVFFDELDAAVLAAPDGREELAALGAEDSGPILAMEPEQIMFALGMLTTTEDAGGTAYVRGYRDAVDHLASSLLGPTPETADPEVGTAGFTDTADSTWGLKATRAAASRFTGRGIRVAVLDTGFDLQHPDFAARNVLHRSFVPGQLVQDGHGHGTHCTGTALGPRTPHPGVPGYGCAPGGEILIGKVLSNGGSGGDQGILAGINWAVAAKCQVISMSLGARVAPGAPASQVYEIVAQRALKAGTLIVAAAGNESARPGRINPVGRPANCPSILAVAALDNTLRVAPFSNGGINPSGGGIDIAGPGVAVFSSLPRPRLHGSFNGTSMATPHVAGIAALLAESNPQLRGRGLWQALVSRARRLLLPSRDVGAGLVQAP